MSSEKGLKQGGQASSPAEVLAATASGVMPDAAGGGRQEREVVPGVFFTPGGGGGGSASAASQTSALGVLSNGGGGGAPSVDIALLGRDALIHLEREVSRSVAKLEESNAEMAAFDPRGEDGELVTARAENEETLARLRARVDRMRERLDVLDVSGHTA